MPKHFQSPKPSQRSYEHTSREIGKRKRLKTVCYFELVVNLVISVTAYTSHQQSSEDRKMNHLTNFIIKNFFKLLFYFKRTLIVFMEQ